MPWNSATSVPGSIARCRSAISAVAVRRGSTTMIFSAGLRAFAASMRRNSTGCAHAAFEPAMKMQVGVVDVLVARRRRIGAQRRLVSGDRARHAQPRIGVDVVGADETLGELVEDVIVLGQQLARDIERDAVGTVRADAVGEAVGERCRASGPTPPARTRRSRAGRTHGRVARKRCASGCIVRCSVLPLLHSAPKLAGCVRVAAHARDARAVVLDDDAAAGAAIAADRSGLGHGSCRVTRGRGR